MSEIKRNTYIPNDIINRALGDITPKLSLGNNNTIRIPPNCSTNDVLLNSSRPEAVFRTRAKRAK
jgi:hypothetical protein